MQNIGLRQCRVYVIQRYFMCDSGALSKTELQNELRQRCQDNDEAGKRIMKKEHHEVYDVELSKND